MPAAKSLVRREPKQRRARQTVDAVLEAVIRVIKREGLQAVTTNRIAEVAGVSIGSVYQYFPDKQAIFNALHTRHVEQMDRLVESTVIRHAGEGLEDLIRAVVEALIEAHAVDPELHELLSTQVPHPAGGTRDFGSRLQGVFRLALAANNRAHNSARDLDKTVFITAHMVDGLSHAVLHRPHSLPLQTAKEEVVEAVMAYLRAQKR